MKIIKKFTFALLALSVMFAFSSCEKQTAKADTSEISFSINNLTNTLNKKATDETVPVCVDGVASYVQVVIDNVPYTLDVLQNLEDGNQTEVLKLPAGTYTINSFVVYNDNGETLYASPMEGSYYEQLWDLNGVALDFETVAFQKKKVTIDVLCYVAYQYEEFGFNWFQYAPIEIKTLCFFGDICTENYEAWHADGSPYFGESYDGYDFPAKYTVNIWSTDGQGNPVAIINTMNNMQMDGPLCIEYPDYVNIPGEEFYAEIQIALPGGGFLEGGVLPGVGLLVPFTDADWSETNGDSTFGGDYGVFDFVWSESGLCDGNDADLVVTPDDVTPQ